MNRTQSPGKAGKDLAELLIKLDKMAVTALNNGCYEEALVCYQKTYDLWASLGLERKGAKTLVNIANILVLLERRSEALELLEKAKTAFQAEGKKNELLDVMRKCIGIYIADGRISEAEQLLSIIKSKCNTPDELGEYTLLQYALMCAKEQNGKGKVLLNRAVQYFEAAQDKMGLCRALQLRKQYYDKMGEQKAAELDRVRIINLLAQE